MRMPCRSMGGVPHRAASVRVDRELDLFLALSRRGRPIDVGLDGTSSLGHVVEALGVPLPEVGLLLVNGIVQHLVDVRFVNIRIFKQS